MTNEEWSRAHPAAAQELQLMLGATAHYVAPGAPARSEAYSQQTDRLRVAHAGGLLWRNNVGASPTKIEHNCPGCGLKSHTEQPAMRWGLCNDSAKLNAKIKSSDLIGIMPRLITRPMVGSTIGQFVASEDKRAGWSYTGTPREVAQLAFLQLVASRGGFATFSTGDLDINQRPGS